MIECNIINWEILFIECIMSIIIGIIIGLKIAKMRENSSNKNRDEIRRKVKKIMNEWAENDD